MNAGRNVDAELVHWGERLFYPGNRIVKADPAPRLQARAAAVRGRIASLVARSPQVIVRVTGGGRGMTAIASHLRYISKSGSLEMEDDHGVVREGKEALHDVVEQWRHGGKFIPDHSRRREAINLVLAMPSDTDPEMLRNAVRDFGRIELAEHRYVMVLHTHQTSPHVHLCARLESTTGERLSHGVGDLRRWRGTFAERLNEWGVLADATDQAVRGRMEHFEPVGQLKARDRGQLLIPAPSDKYGRAHTLRCLDAMDCWIQIVDTLAASERSDDLELGWRVRAHLSEMPFVNNVLRPSLLQQRDHERDRQHAPQHGVTLVRPELEIQR